MKVRFILSLLAVTVLVFAACSDDDDPVAPPPVPLSQFNTSNMPLTVPGTFANYGNMAADDNGNLLLSIGGGPNGHLYEVSRDTGQLRILTTDIGAAEGGPYQTRSVVYDSDADLIYVGSASAAPARVWAVDPTDGSHSLLIDLGNIGSPCALLIAPAGFGSFGGHLLVCMMNGQGIHAVDLSNPVSSTQVAAGDFDNGEFAPDGTLYCTEFNNNRVVTVAADGTVTPFADVPACEGIAINSSGSILYIASSVDSLFTVSVPGAVVTSVKEIKINGGWAPTGMVYDNGKLLAGIEPTNDFVVDDITP